MSKLSKLLTATAVLGAAAGAATYFYKKTTDANTEPADDTTPSSGEIKREYMSLKKEVESSFGEVNDADCPSSEEAASQLSQQIKESVDSKHL